MAPAAHGEQVLSVDIGSSSIRSGLYSSSLEVVPGSWTRVPYAMETPPGGGSQIDPYLLADRVFDAIDGALSPDVDVAAVALSTLVSNVLGLDADGKPVTPIYTWADTRSAPQAGSLRASLDEEGVRRRTGCYIHTSYLPARILWLREVDPALFARVHKWVSLGEWLHLCLLGDFAQSISLASWSGLLDRQALDWDVPLLEALGLSRDRLPPIAADDQYFTGLRPEFAERWPRLRRARWYPAWSDGLAGNAGSGCEDPGRTAVQVGTSSAMRVMLPGAPTEIPAGLWAYRANSQATLLGGSLSEGGNLLDWLKSILGEDGFAAAARRAASLSPDSHGLTLLPTFAGERSPGWDPLARGAIAGLTLSTGPAELLRAVTESLALRLGFIYARLLPVVGSAGLVVASGSALLQTPGWLQMLADVLGVPVAPLEDAEASSRGAALLALRNCGLLRPDERLYPKTGPALVPNSAARAIYMAAAERQTSLSAALDHF